MALTVLITLVLAGSYILVILFIASRVSKGESLEKGEISEPSRVSIIVPFRNEARNLHALVSDLQDQSYPSELYELIFVDDHSGDGSRTILDSLLSGLPGARVLGLPPGKEGKKAALYHGIQKASHDLLIQVDADCRLGSGFIESHMAFMANKPSDLVAGLATTSRRKGGFLEAFERLDLLALTGTGAGSFGLGRPMMCSGANLAYSRELFMETRKFDPVETIPSGDDMFLMIGARKLKRSLEFNVDHEACVKSTPVRSFRALLAQRIRWGSKSTRFGMADIQGLAVLVSLTNLGMLLMPLFFLLFPWEWPWLAGVMLGKTLADFVLLYRVSGLCKQRESLFWFVPVMLVYYPFFLVTLLGILLGRPGWKGN